MLPKITIVRLLDAESDEDVVVAILGRLGGDLRDVANIKAHELDGIAYFESRSAAHKREVRQLAIKPAFAMGSLVDVVGQTGQQEQRGYHHEQAHEPFQPAEAGAQLRRQVLQRHGEQAWVAWRFIVSEHGFLTAHWDPEPRSAVT